METVHGRRGGRWSVIVCCHSGQPQASCDYSCPHCRSTYRACPDHADVLALCVEIRRRWPVVRLLAAEGYAAAETPSVRAVTDRMVRRDGERK